MKEDQLHFRWALNEGPAGFVWVSVGTPSTASPALPPKIGAIPSSNDFLNQRVYMSGVGNDWLCASLFGARPFLEWLSVAGGLLSST